jgi:hypothetical protein
MNAHPRQSSTDKALQSDDLSGADQYRLVDPTHVIARSGRVHDIQCLALTHDGPCECSHDLPHREPRRRPKAIRLESSR